MKVGNLLMQDGAAAINDMKAKMADANGVSGNGRAQAAGLQRRARQRQGQRRGAPDHRRRKAAARADLALNDYVAPGINMLTTLADAVSGDTEAFNSPLARCKAWPRRCNQSAAL